MKAWIKIAIVCLMGNAPLAAQTTGENTAANGGKQLTILHTSDMHSRVLPIPAGAADEYAGRGGLVRRASCVEQERLQDPELLLLDCGDFSQGSPYYNLFKGEVEVKMMNRMKYDAITIGNHEFDFGLENMARIYRMADFPVVCANYDVKGTVLEGLVKPYVVLQRKGIRIGIFGLSPQMEGLVQAEKCEGITFLDPVEAAQQTIDLLREKEQCDVVICLSHLGINIADANSDDKWVAKTHGVDIILGGHTHTFMDQPANYLNSEGRNVAVMHSGKNGVNVGKMTVYVE